MEVKFSIKHRDADYIIDVVLDSNDVRKLISNKQFEIFDIEFIENKNDNKSNPLSEIEEQIEKILKLLAIDVKEYISQEKWITHVKRMLYPILFNKKDVKFKVQDKLNQIISTLDLDHAYTQCKKCRSNWIHKTNPRPGWCYSYQIYEPNCFAKRLL